MYAHRQAFGTRANDCCAYIPASGMFCLVMHDDTLFILSDISNPVALALLEAMQCFCSCILAYAGCLVDWQCSGEIDEAC